MHELQESAFESAIQQHQSDIHLVSSLSVRKHRHFETIARSTLLVLRDKVMEFNYQDRLSTSILGWYYNWFLPLLKNADAREERVAAVPNVIGAQ